jgi:hypothetical protein
MNISKGRRMCVCMYVCMPPTFMLVSYAAYSSTLKTEAIYSSEISIDFQHLHYITSQKVPVFKSYTAE